ncbi:3-phosphoshikimate 1-carboxyvinyltransferase [Chloroflexota bacterium]
MKVLIHKSEVKGRVVAPSSKSYTLRGLMCAALSSGKSEIINPLSSDDTEAGMNVLSEIGVRVHQERNLWEVIGDNFREPDTDLFCGESAATLRFMAAICSVVPGRCRLVGGPSLSQRPVKPLVEALRQLGINCSCQGETAPVVVNGRALGGGITEIPGNVSSQFVSALLLVSPFAEKGIEINLTTPLESQPYVLMTLECLEKFGVKVTASRNLRQFEVSRQTYQPAKYHVEGDWSSASYLLALGALSGEVEVANLNLDSLQGDKILLNYLRDMGALIEVNQDSVTVRKSRLKAIKADLTDYTDLLPTMAVLAAAADGISQFTGIERTRIKESNRVAALRKGLERMGVEVIEENNSLTIVGSTPKGSVIDSQNDHRIAMAFGILGSVAGETTIDNAECVAKTFSQFWDILKSIGGKVEIDGK